MFSGLRRRSYVAAAALLTIAAAAGSSPLADCAAAGADAPPLAWTRRRWRWLVDVGVACSLVRADLALCLLGDRWGRQPAILSDAASPRGFDVAGCWLTAWLLGFGYACCRRGCLAKRASISARRPRAVL